MDKNFTLIDNKVYYQRDGKWYRCTITAEGVEVQEKAAITPGERYSALEIKAKVKPQDELTALKEENAALKKELNALQKENSNKANTGNQ